MEKKVPFTKVQIEKLALNHPTPFYVYDEAGIRATARSLNEAFSWAPSYKNFFAVKATPNPHILSVLRDEKNGADCSSLPELLLSERVGLRGDAIMFTSNDTPIEEFAKAKELGAYINLDATEHLEYIEKHIGLPRELVLRYNPGPLREGNAIIGKPEEAKFGMTREQVFDTYDRAMKKGVTHFGLHTMVISNERRTEYFLETAKMLFALAEELRVKGIPIELINLGGGFGIPYRPSENLLDLQAISEGIRKLFDSSSLKEVQIATECGRYVTGPHGYLVARVRHLKETYRKYAALDATMANLMRPGMYGAYHHISVLGREEEKNTASYDVVGSLCENNDKFAIDRLLPELHPEDIIVIHDAGAHGHAMGFNYNGKLRSAEFLLTNGIFKMIRRAESIDDHFATLSF